MTRQETCRSDTAMQDDLTGRRFGRLVVISPAESRTPPSGGKRRYWKCRCDCGTEKEIAESSLKSGATKSCGCLQKELTSKACVTHGESNTRLYRIWSAMKCRCNNPNFWEFNNYGGRGITVCDEWNRDFLAFKSWAMNNGYKEALTIDRIDSNGQYSPDNCRWIPAEQQSTNRRYCMYIEWNGETLTPSQWHKRTGIPYSTIVYRYHKGWPPEIVFKEVV